MSKPTPALKAEMLHRRFRGLRVLNGIYFAAYPGRVAALLGRNGTGKSTLLNILAGALPANEGMLFYDGRRVFKPKLHTVARLGLFYVPQDTFLLSDIPVAAQFRSFVRGFAGSEPAVALLDIPKCLAFKPRLLSGGEKRRCDIAPAFLARHRYLLVDEPFTGLAPIDAKRIAAGLKALAQQGSTVIITDHAVEHTLSIADDVWFLEEGTCTYLGNAEDALRNEFLRRRYLGERLGLITIANIRRAI